MSTILIPQLVTYLRDYLLPIRGRATFLGEPGIGKTTVGLVEAARAIPTFNPRVHYQRVGHWTPCDAHGVPMVYRTPAGHDVAKWAPMDFLPIESIFDEADGDGGCLILDEVAQAPDTVQAGCQRILDLLPRNWAVLSMGNQPGQNASAHRILSTWVSRCHGYFVVKPDLKYWVAQCGNSTDDRIVSFLAMCPHLLSEWDFKVDGSQPNPRSWSRLSEVIRNHREPPQYVIEGSIGEACGVQFFNFCQVMHDLPDAGDVLDDPGGYQLPQDLSVVHALVAACAAKAKEAPDKDAAAAALATLYNRMPLDIATMAYVALQAWHPTVQRTKPFGEYARRIKSAAS